MKGEIKARSDAKGYIRLEMMDGSIYSVWESQGKQHNPAHDEAMKCHPSYEVEFEFVEKTSGDKTYRNITALKVLDSGMKTEYPPQGTQTPKPYGKSPVEIMSIQKQVCLKCACEIAPPGQAVVDILNNAEKMLEWIVTP
jgi:hypothetical protein